MTLLCVRQEDKFKTWPEVFQPHRTVSFWDMLRFKVEILVELAHLFGEQKGAIQVRDVWLEFARHCEGLSKVHSRPSLCGFSVENFKKIQDFLRSLGLSVSVAAAERITQFKEGPWDDNDMEYIDQSCTELIHILQYELESKYALILDPARAHFYENEGNLFSGKILDEFPELREDVEEACKCYALERNTACVFHLMRVMERCLQEWARKLDIELERTYDKQWQQIINAVRNRLKELYPNEKDPNRIREEGRLGYLETVKIRWRNPTMHPKETYTGEEAWKIIGAVQALVEDFVKLR